MKASLIPASRIEEVRRKPQKVAENDPFPVIHSQRLDTLSLSGLSLPDDEKLARRQLVRSYTESVRAIGELQTELVKLITAVIRAWVWGVAGEKHQQMFQSKLSEELERMPNIPLEVTDSLFAEIMVNEPEAIKTLLLGSLSETLERLLSTFRASLDHLRGTAIGQIEWFGPSVCVYDFYRTRRTERKTGQREEVQAGRSESAWAWEEYETTTKVQKYGTFDVLERHEHHLYNARRFQLPAREVRKPHFVTEFVRSVPQWLAPHVFVVEGDMLREDIDASEKKVGERQVVIDSSRRIIRSGNLYSPAVTLGDYVMTGWSGRDL